MSATEQMRDMLAQLMGTGRDGEETSGPQVRFDDSRVCKSFLLGCCPHEILASTRMDLGECSRIHNWALKADYENASKERDYYYDIDAMEHLKSFIADCDRKTELAKRRLKETQEELSEEARAKAEVIHQLGEEMGTKLARAEEVGEKGDVESSLRLMQEVEDLKKKKSEAEIEYRNSMPASSYQQQKLRVCEVCSAYLGIHDNDRRLADHFGGKLHLGFIAIRTKLTELEKTVADRREQREMERMSRRQEEEDERVKRRERDAKEKEREELSRSKDKDRRRRSRSRSRGKRSSRRSRSRSRDRRRRSRSRSRHRRRRSRSRSKSRRSSRDRKRHSRSRSSSRHRRSSKRSRRSRSRSGSKSKRSVKSGSPSERKEENNSYPTPDSEPTEKTELSEGAENRIPDVAAD